jgi:hypothetical protein
MSNTCIHGWSQAKSGVMSSRESKEKLLPGRKRNSTLHSSSGERWSHRHSNVDYWGSQKSQVRRQGTRWRAQSFLSLEGKQQISSQIEATRGKPRATQRWPPWVLEEAHACNPSYSGDRDQDDRSSKTAPANSLQAPVSKKIPSQKRTGGVAQGVSPEFKPWYCKKKKKKREGGE